MLQFRRSGLLGLGFRVSLLRFTQRVESPAHIMIGLSIFAGLLLC